MCFQKVSVLPGGRSLEIRGGAGGGEGFLKAKLLEEKYETKLVFPWGQGGCKTIHLPWREYGYFLELHSCSVKCLIYCT